MEEIRKAIKKQLIISLFLTFGFIAGIPTIVLSAINRIWVLMAIGIAMTVVGFYGMPISWVLYGRNRSLERVVYAVTEEHLYSVQAIASQLRKFEFIVRRSLGTCLRKRYLVGYVLNGDTITVNEAVHADETLHAHKCPYCGANFSYTGTVAKCPYCGSVSEKAD